MLDEAMWLWKSYLIIISNHKKREEGAFITQSPNGGKIYLGSQSEGTVHQARDGMTAGTWGCLLTSQWTRIPGKDRKWSGLSNIKTPPHSALLPPQSPRKQYQQLTIKCQTCEPKGVISNENHDTWRREEKVDRGEADSVVVKNWLNFHGQKAQNKHGLNNTHYFLSCKCQACGVSVLWYTGIQATSNIILFHSYGIYLLLVVQSSGLVCHSSHLHNRA